jgi:autotransporter-associated beta strand protein
MRSGVARSLALLFSAAFIGISLSASARAQFGTGTDIYWAQTNGSTPASANAGSSSDPTGFSVDGLWDDTSSTGYASPNNVPAGSYPSINWSTNAAGAGAAGFTPAPGPYPSGSPNPYDPGYIPGSPGNTNVDVVFSATDGTNSTSSILVNYSPTVLGLYITNPGKITEIRTASSTAPETITIGSDGLTIEPTVDTSPFEASASNILFGNANAALTLAVNGSQTWANLTVNNGTVSAVQGVTFTGPVTVPATVTSPLTLTLSAPGDNPATGFPANNHLNGYISDNTTLGGVLSIDVTSGQWTLGAGGTPPAGSSTYTGGLTVENNAQVRDIYLTGAGTGTVTVNSGGSFCPNTGNGSSIYANPIVINGTGDALAGVNGLTTFGAIHSMNTGAAASTSTDTLSGGITLGSNSLVEAQYSSLIIATNPVVLNSNTLTLAGAGGTDNISISVSSAIQGLGGVTVNTASGTAGTVTLSNANNTYSGNTTIATGILALSTTGNNNIADSALIQVNSGATFNVTGVTGTGAFGLASGQTLSGEGTVTGVLSVLSGAHLDPGGPPGTIGTLNTAQVTLKPGAILDYEFGASSNDFLNSASGNLVIGTSPSASDIAVNLFQAGNPTAAFDTPGTYDLIGYAASITGEGIPALYVGNPQAGFSYVFGTDAAHSNDVDLTIAAVPEPASLLLLAVGLTLACWAGVRRAKAAA